MANILRVTSIGEKALDERLARAGEAGHKLASKIAYRKAEEIAGKAKDAVPVDTGALKSTIHVEREDGGSKWAVEIVAGGPSAGYGAIVHEDLRAHHDVGGPKYIERPFLEVLPSIGQAIIDAIDRAEKGR